MALDLKAFITSITQNARDIATVHDRLYDALAALQVWLESDQTAEADRQLRTALKLAQGSKKWGPTGDPLS